MIYYEKININIETFLKLNLWAATPPDPNKKIFSKYFNLSSLLNVCLEKLKQPPQFVILSICKEMS